MSDSNIIKPKTFDPSNLTFSEVKTNKHGGKSVYMNYNGGKFTTQFPAMHIPYPLKEDDIVNSKTGAVEGKKYSVNLSFRGMDDEYKEHLPAKVRNNARRLREFHEMLQAIEKRVLEEGVQQSGSWLQQKGASEAVVKALMSSAIKVSKDANGEPNGKWPDTVKTKIMYWDGVFNTEVYNESKEPVDLQENLQKGAVVAGLIEFAPIWFAGGKLGISMRLKQALMKKAPTESAQSGYMMLPESDDEDDEGEEEQVISLASKGVEASSEASSVASSVASDEVEESAGGQDLDAGVESSDEESESEEEEAPPPPPKKIKKTKKTKKPKT